MNLRPPQQRFNEICQSINNGENITDILIFAVPGAGKSTIPAIASQLIHDDKTKILWVCPRDSLVDQAEKNFRGDEFFDVGDMDIRVAKNNGCPFRGNQGAVTTYQSIIASPDRWIKLSKDYKLILFLDEFDSLTEYSGWTKPITEIYNNSILRIPATGTIDRSDNLPVSFVPYLKNGDIDFSETESRKWIIYDNEQALKDGSILGFDSTLISGSGSYIDLDGITRNFSKFSGNGNELETAFKTEFAYQMFNASVNHWIEFRKNNPWSKMLVISNNIKIANEYTRWFKQKGYRFEVATSENTSECKETIKRFKLDNSNRRAFDGMVTVAVAYKGLDVKQATFLVFLTKIRGKAWISQAVGRIQRAYTGKVKGFLYAPDDPKLKSVLKKLACGHIESATGEPPEPTTSEKSESTGPARTIEALNSKAHIEDIPLFSGFIPKSEIIETESQSEKEHRLRTEINSHINRIFGKESPGNKRVKQRIFYLRIKMLVNNGRDDAGKLQTKHLNEMSIKELEKCVKFAQNYK